MKAYQHITAFNDNNGNPRRLFLVYDGPETYAIDEGYSGRPAWLSAFRELVPVRVNYNQYRALLKDYPEPSAILKVS